MGFIIGGFPFVGCRKSKVDPDNPPPLVVKAAADFGVSVHDFKLFYLDGPDICESAADWYRTCMNTVIHRKEDTTICQTLAEIRRKRQCDKFDKKYRKLIQKELW